MFNTPTPQIDRRTAERVITVVSLIVVVLAFVASLLAPAAAAQPASPTASPSPTATTTSTPTATPEPVNETTNIVVGPYTRIVGWEYDRGSFTLRVRTGQPTTLSLVEPPPEGETEGNIRFARRQLRPGLNIINIDVPVRGGTATLWLSTPQGTAEGTAAYIQARENQPLIGGPWTARDAQTAGFGGAFGTAVVVLYNAVRIVRGRGERGEQVA